MTRKTIAAFTLGFTLAATAYKLTRPIPVRPAAVPDTIPEYIVQEGREKGWL